MAIWCGYMMWLYDVDIWYGLRLCLMFKSLNIGSIIKYSNSIFWFQIFGGGMCGKSGHEYLCFAHLKNSLLRLILRWFDPDTLMADNMPNSKYRKSIVSALKFEVVVGHIILANIYCLMEMKENKLRICRDRVSDFCPKNYGGRV